MELQPDVLADDTAKHFSQAENDFVQIKFFRLHHLAAAEEEQLAGEIRGALSVNADLQQAFLDRLRYLLLHSSQFRLHHDGGENIVEIVRDAAGKPADGLHLLGVAQLFLQLATLGNIPGQTYYALDLTAGTTHRKSAVTNPAHLAIGPNDSVFLVVGAGSLLSGGRAQNALAVVGMDCLKPGAGLSIEALAGASPHPFVSRADVKHPILRRVGDPKDFLNGLRQFTEALLAGPERLLRLLALGCVANHRHHIIALQMNVGDADLDRKKRAIFAPMLALDQAGTGAPYKVPDFLPGPASE